MGCRNNGLSEQWAVGIMGCRNNDLTPQIEYTNDNIIKNVKFVYIHMLNDAPINSDH